MFRLIRFLSTPGGRRVLFWLLIIGVLYLVGGFILESLNPRPEYTRPSGWFVTTVCNTGGKDCDENGFIRLWTSGTRTSSTFVRSPQAPSCVATKSIESNKEKFWWIDCGLWQGRELPIIEGWVSEMNLKFTGESTP